MSIDSENSSVFLIKTFSILLSLLVDLLLDTMHVEIE
jgi:hypothetical protein